MSEALQRIDYNVEVTPDEETAEPESDKNAFVTPEASDARPPERLTPADRPDIPDLSQIDPKRWDTARSRYEIIKPILEAGRPYNSQVQAVSSESGLGAATLYRWIEDFNEGGKDATALCPRPRGRSRRPKIGLAVIDVIHAKFEGYHATKQQPKYHDTCVEVEDECRRQGLPIPSSKTITRYIKRFEREAGEKAMLERRSNKKLADDKYSLRMGTFRTHLAPWFGVQIDHTELNIMVVDEEYRLSVGRPYLTYAICPYSRMILGFRISFDPVGASSTGLCLLHAMLPKDDWLREHNVPNRWPCYGKPASLHFDNGKEFLGNMIVNACGRYDINIEHRPVQVPHFGGHVERAIQTLNEYLRKSRGATFANPQERAEYDSDEEAIYTLTELEGLVTEWITGEYHKRRHRGIGRTPIAKYEEGIKGSTESLAAGRRIFDLDRRRLQLDFTPEEKRTIQRTGVHFDNLVYTSEVLAPYVNAKDENGDAKRFTFRRDPRRINHIWFYADDVNEYYRIPLRDPHPDISLWEWNVLWRRNLKESNLEVDQNALFESRERQRRREDEAAARTRAARRNKERRLRHGREMAMGAPVQPNSSVEGEDPDWSDVQPSTGARLL